MPAKKGLNLVDLLENVFHLCVCGYSYRGGIMLAYICRCNTSEMAFILKVLANTNGCMYKVMQCYTLFLF